MAINRHTPTNYTDVAKELYPDLVKYDYFSAPYDYNPIIKWIGTPLVQVDEDNYQGDTLVALTAPNKDNPDHQKYGLLIFGWGSCSGCDALQGCNSWEEVGDLIEQLTTSVQWYPTINALKHAIATKDWKGTWVTEDLRDKFTYNVARLPGDGYYVYKYPLQAGSTAPMQLPIGAQVLHVGHQRGQLYLWALVDPTQPTEDRKIWAQGTGTYVGNITKSQIVHLGTVQIPNTLLGELVWHVFEEVPC